MRKFTLLLLTTTFLASVGSQPVRADEWRGHEEWHDRGDIHHFHEHDYEHWRGGRWFNGFHEGRNGWWWIVDGGWYFYPSPVYPYPDPYTPPTVIVEQAPAPVSAPPSSVYYCTNPQGYYPYVPLCSVPWQKVAGAPATVVQQSAPMVPHQRDVDGRKLGALTVEFEKIDPRDPHARARLRSVEKKVEVFRQALYKRDYNAMDLLKDADGLQHRIADEKEMLSKHVIQQAPPPATTMVPPPGSSVPFPPQ
jgi:hypothetical protein